MDDRLTVCARVGCGREFRPRRGRHPHVYCSKRCGNVVRLAREAPSVTLGLCAGDVGTVGELIVSADLIMHGWQVFRAISPAATCDIVAMKGDQVIRVEVKKAQRLKRDPSLVNHGRALRGRYDVLALWFSDLTINYSPGLPSEPAG